MVTAAAAAAGWAEPDRAGLAAGQGSGRNAARALIGLHRKKKL